LALPSRTTLAALGGIAIVAIAGPWLAGWVPTGRLLELSACVIAAMFGASLREQRCARADRTMMPPAFVVIFAALILLGGNAATSVAVAAALTAAILPAPVSRRDLIVDLTIAVAAVQGAHQAHQWMGRLSARAVVWPWMAVAIAAAVVAYHVIAGGVARIAVPFVTRKPIDRSWLRRPLSGLPMYLLGASAAVILVQVIEGRMWDLAAVVAAAMFCAYWIYADYVHRLEEAHRRREVLGFLEQGMSVLDANGRVTLWNDALERIFSVSRSHALGRQLTDLMPALARTDLPRAIRDTIGDREGRVLNHLRFTAGRETRLVQVKVLPVVGGVSLLWNDVTERTHAEHEMRQRGDRLALAAEAANDGLWQWNLQTREFYASSRWRAMIGLPAHAAVGGPGEWLDRVHPEDIGSLNAALDAHLAGATQVFHHEHRIRHVDGTYRRFLCRGLAVRGAGKKPDRIAGSLTDTTEQALAQEKLRSVGFQDSLTGTFNRAVFVEALGRRLDECRRRGTGGGFAVLYLDLDRFKIVNDSLGHMVGDELLVAASRRLESCLRHGDALARLGGDEFAILLNGLYDEGQANAIAGRIQEALSSPFAIGGREVFTSASIGIAFGPAHYTNPDEIMRDADTAMYHAKSRGKARHEIFDADMHARVRDRLSLESDLRRAIATNGFEVHYQPIVLLNSGMCVGFESLVRWTRNGEPVSPVTFVPIAEELGLIDQLGTWVMKEACRTFANWQRQYPASGLDYITVNVSSRQLVQQNFSRLIKNTVLESGLKPGDLRVEITETALLDSPGEAAGVLRELRDFGVKVYLDDFGTGYSSLSHLHKLPVDALKIDRSFVNSLLIPGRPAIVESILALARTLNTSVVAEGIESDVQARELARLGCTHAQGYLFSRPLSTERAEQVVMENRPLGPLGENRPLGPLGEQQPAVAILH
jgi:diguanylate cyclase (GGDEF)-like protein/PAS domain S-box-containing protein